MSELQKRTWAEISLDNIEHNYRAVRAELPESCRYLGVVKADAYGHGPPRWRIALKKAERIILPCRAWTRRWSFGAAA
jgi:alanine racemase